MRSKLLGLAIISLAALSCTKETESLSGTIPGDLNELSVPDGFSYRTTETVQADISVLDLEDQPLNGIKVNFYSDDPVQGGKLLGIAITDNGEARTSLRIPAYLDSVFVQVAFPGFANSRNLMVQPNLVAGFGGKPLKKTTKKSGTASGITPAGDNFYFMGSFNGTGVPDYLENPGDNLTTQFLSDVNASFPESRPVPQYNPQYLLSGNQMDVVLNDISDVYVTFVTEGAGYRNVLVYYTHDNGQPPATPSDIDSLFVVFPNASFNGSGGGLQAGDKVHLGRFPAGKTISWALIADGWKSKGSGLNTKAPVYFANPALNTLESDPARRQHSVQLLDNSRQLLLNGFEDLPRSSNASDDDFNDLMFYVTATPWTAVETSNIPPTQITYDQDGDGAPDDVDDYPNDPARAYNISFSGTLAFEDLWPSRGDYDFNDLVLGYDITHISNASNEVVEMEMDWIVRAIGTPFKNGFGFQFLNVVPSQVQMVSGQKLTESYVLNNSNNTEAGQSLATIIAFDNAQKVLKNPGSKFINTFVGQAYAEPETLSVAVTFTNPVAIADIGLPPYNSFIMIKGNRGQEVHLPDHQPTDLANVSTFKTLHDDTDPAIGKYYKTSNNLPWAISIPEEFQYPAEYESISDAYVNFAPWAMSGGYLHHNWFLDLPGFRDISRVY